MAIEGYGKANGLANLPFLLLLFPFFLSFFFSSLCIRIVSSRGEIFFFFFGVRVSGHL